jgi:hypothetical protein
MTLVTKDVPNRFGIHAMRGGMNKTPAPAVRFTLIDDNSSEVVYRSNKLNNTEFDYWIVIKVRYMPEWTDEYDYTYYATMSTVAPSQVPQNEKHACLDCMSIDRDQKLNEEDMALLLEEYGTSACIWQESGNNKTKLIKAAKTEAQAVEMMFGYYMDQPLNLIGSTGWDFLTGDITAPLRRYQET